MTKFEQDIQQYRRGVNCVAEIIVDMLERRQFNDSYLIDARDMLLDSHREVRAMIDGIRDVDEVDWDVTAEYAWLIRDIGNMYTASVKLLDRQVLD